MKKEAHNMKKKSAEIRLHEIPSDNCLLLHQQGILLRDLKFILLHRMLG